MCYSALVWSDFRRYTRDFNVKIGIKEFFDLFVRRSKGAKLTIPRGVEAAFAHPQTDEERDIQALIEEFRQHQASKFEQEVFEQRTRLVEADRRLATKVTKAASESKRIATDKVERALSKIADLRRDEPRESDSRMFPGSYVPVMVMEDGELVIKPMRYQCRPARAPASYDHQYPGTFNARRDNLERFWRDEFGHTHGLVVATSFFENVPLHKSEQRDLREDEKESNLILQYKPNPMQDMLVACVWSRWTSPRSDEPALLSFAFVTDEPPPEVAAAGHDRCIVPIRRENVMSWLNPDASDLAAQHAILDDRERPYYEHRLAA